MKRGALALLLAPTLGQEKSEEVVRTACARLGFGEPEELRVDQAVAVIDLLGQSEGIVGVVARFVKVRGELEDLVDTPPPSSPPTAPSLPPGPAVLGTMTPGGGVAFARPRAADVKTGDLLAFFAPALGDEKSRETIAIYAARVGATGPDFSYAQALQMLELMAQAEGILGVVARFAKARFILTFPS